MESVIGQEFNEHISAAMKTMDTAKQDIEIAAKLCVDGLKNENKILIFGNGGSAADAQHIAAEIVGRYKVNRKGLPAIALTTDSSAITAISNDFGYLHVFDRQVEALAKNGDILIGISSGGTSVNVVNALKVGKDLGCKIIGLSGRDGGEFNSLCDINIVVPANDTPRIQEMHIVIGHILCHLIDLNYSTSS